MNAWKALASDGAGDEDYEWESSPPSLVGDGNDVTSSLLDTPVGEPGENHTNNPLMSSPTAPYPTGTTTAATKPASSSPASLVAAALEQQAAAAAAAAKATSTATTPASSAKPHQQQQQQQQQQRPPMPSAASIASWPLARERPCDHNEWVRVSRMSGTQVFVRCKTCGVTWRTDLSWHTKCPDHFSGGCKLQGACQHVHIYRVQSKKRKAWKKLNVFLEDAPEAEVAEHNNSGNKRNSAASSAASHDSQEHSHKQLSGHHVAAVSTPSSAAASLQHSFHHQHHQQQQQRCISSTSWPPSFQHVVCDAANRDDMPGARVIGQLIGVAPTPTPVFTGQRQQQLSAVEPAGRQSPPGCAMLPLAAAHAVYQRAPASAGAPMAVSALNVIPQQQAQAQQQQQQQQQPPQQPPPQQQYFLQAFPAPQYLQQPQQQPPQQQQQPQPQQQVQYVLQPTAQPVQYQAAFPAQQPNTYIVLLPQQ